MGFIKKIFLLIIVGLVVGSKSVLAVDYQIENFDSEIRLNQDLSLTVKEKIETNFLVEKHGIYRIIPYIYNHKGKTIKANLKILSITDENGIGIDYEVTNYNQSKKIKIGDADKTIIGKKEYIIEYKVDQVVLDYGEGPEIYWNVTGNEWEVLIKKAVSKVISPFGEITKIECFGCQNSFNKNKAEFTGKQGLTVVVQIDKNNQLKMPGVFRKIINFIVGNLGYVLAIIPTILMTIVWYKKGRDKKYLSENIYYQPENQKEQNVNIFERPHLPLVYSPIKNLSPAEVGTILDENIDINDIVAEIVELARLGYLTIKKIETKGFLGLKNVDYQLSRTEKQISNLNNFQINLIKDLFDIVEPKIAEGVEKAATGLNKNKKELLKDVFDDLRIETKSVNISDLKNHFYKHLPELRKCLFEILDEKKISDGNWEKIRLKWITVMGVFGFLLFTIIPVFMKNTISGIGPIIMLIVGLIINIFLAIKMPRKTAWGYSLHRQIVGLKYYLSKGKWREEIMEKNLFLEEMLPLAISLGIVNQLANDMKDLELKPPKYFEGMMISSFVHDLNNFNSVMATNLSTTPSGNSNWSGGSGFSGGSSGGGFGGGGGGSW